MKKIAIFYNVTLGIFWEAVYVMVIIAVGLLFEIGRASCRERVYVLV